MLGVADQQQADQQLVESAPAQAPSPVAPVSSPNLVDAASRPWQPPPWLEEEERQRKGTVRRSHSAPMDVGRDVGRLPSPEPASREDSCASMEPPPPPPPEPVPRGRSAAQRSPKAGCRPRSSSKPGTTGSCSHQVYSRARLGPPQRPLRRIPSSVVNSNAVAPLLPSVSGPGRKVKRDSPASQRERKRSISAGASVATVAEDTSLACTANAAPPGQAVKRRLSVGTSRTPVRRGMDSRTHRAPSSRTHSQPRSFLDQAAAARAELLRVGFHATAPRSSGLFASPPRRSHSRGTRRRSRGDNEVPKPSSGDHDALRQDA